MSAGVSKQDVTYIYGKSSLNKIDKDTLKRLKESRTSSSTRKYILARSKVNELLIKDWVKFIGISGSVAAGFAKDDDDIDIFLVVKNNTAWIYRLILQIKNIRSNIIRTKRLKNVKDKFCMNYIVEERGLSMPEDIFTFHELMYIKPIYKEDYLKVIYAHNSWLKNWKVKNSLINKDYSDIKTTDKNILVSILNDIAYVLQIVFMCISLHKPDIKRIIEEYKNGQISFYEKDFKEIIVDNYYKSFKLKS